MRVMDSSWRIASRGCNVRPIRQAGRGYSDLQRTARRAQERHIGTCSDGGSGSDPPQNKLPAGGDGEEDDQGGFPAWKLVWTGALAMSLTARPAHALRLRKKRTKDNPPHLDVLLDQSWPILKNLGFSGVLGVMAALAFKTVGRSLAIVVGALFTIVQLGAYFGYLKVDWARVHKDVHGAFDVNHDGKTDSKDYKAVSARLLAILSQGVPSVGGFCGGFSLGLGL